MVLVESHICGLWTTIETVGALCGAKWESCQVLFFYTNLFKKIYNGHRNRSYFGQITFGILLFFLVDTIISFCYRYRAALAAAPTETAVPLLSVTCRDLHFANQGAPSK